MPCNDCMHAKSCRVNENRLHIRQNCIIVRCSHYKWLSLQVARVRREGWACYVSCIRKTPSALPLLITPR